MKKRATLAFWSFALAIGGHGAAAEASVSDSDSVFTGATEDATRESHFRLPPDLMQTANLPPFIVSDSRIIRWRYLSLPGFEILSCCDDARTEKFAEEICREQFLLNQMVSPDLQARSVVPTTLILLSEEMKEKLADRINAVSGQDGKSAGADPPLFMRQIKLQDADSTSVDIVLDQDYGEYKLHVTKYKYEPQYIYFALERRLPPPPAWFIEAMVNYRYKGPKNDPVDNFHFGRAYAEGDDVSVTVPPALWLSRPITAYLASVTSHSLTDPDFKPPGFDDTRTSDIRTSPIAPLLPMGRLLSESPPPLASDEERKSWIERVGPRPIENGDLKKNRDRALELERFLFISQHEADDDSPWRSELWNSQVLLFVRWAFDDKTNARREGLWKLAARASTEPVTEAMFKDCFGMGFDEARRELRSYLPKALREEGSFLWKCDTNIPEFRLRDATEAESARILGDWESKEIDFVKIRHPEYAEQYRKKAARTVMKAYDHGARDPDLLAVLGLYECRVGAGHRAREFLEAAVAAHVVRPRAYVELARIRYADALAKPAMAGGRLDSEQVASVLDLLKAIQAQPPPQLDGYLLAADAWGHASVAPAAADLALLDKGLSFFPYEPRLLLTARHLKIGQP